MPAKLGLDRRVGHLALLQAGHRGRELGHVAGAVGPVQVAAIDGRAGVLRRSLGHVLELGAALDLGDDCAGVGFLLHQDVADVVFLAVAELRLDLVVLLAQFVVAGAVGAHVVLEHRAGQHVELGLLELLLHVVALGDAALVGFLQQQFPVDQHGAGPVAQLGAGGLAGAGDQLVQLGRGDGLAIHNGGVLGDCGQAASSKHSRQAEREDGGLHGIRSESCG
ncbi:hypothetical protein D3C86_1347820 [compost metagenome]